MGKVDPMAHGKVRGGVERMIYVQMRSNGFFPSHVIDICSGDAQAAVFGLEAANATAALFDGGEVVCRGSVAQVDRTRGCDRVSETL